MFTIGPFSRLAGVSPKALRTYDRLALFRPVWVDRATGYRFYSPAQLPDLRRILALRDMGVGLAEIAALVTGGSDLRATLERRRAELKHERREIERRLAELDIRVEQAAGSSIPDVVVRPLATEPVATLDVGLVRGGDVGAAFYELEAHVRDAGRRAHRPPGALVHEPRNGGGTVEVFVPINGRMPATDRIGVRRLPACRAATVIHRGPYDSVPDARSMLERWVAVAGLRADGPMRVLYLQFGAERELALPRGWVVEAETDYVTELQQPVA